MLTANFFYQFAIKLGQKRKEKRLSALEELTCTYSIEEMKMPKIMDTAQPQQLRATNLCSLSVVSNNNLKEIIHNQHRTVGVSIGTILTTANSNSTNNTTSNSNISSTVYSVPLVSICTGPDSEADVTWTTDQYRQQRDQLTESANNRSKVGDSVDSNPNQSQIIGNQHVNPIGQLKQTESSVPNGSNTSSTESVKTDTGSCVNDSENNMSVITKPPSISVGPHVDVSSLSNIGCGGTGVKSKHLTSNADQPLSVTEYISIKGTQSTENAVVNNQLSVLLSASCPKIKVSVPIL